MNTGSSLKVQYAYTEMASSANHSRLTAITYPNGKVLTFNYSSGLNSNISRLSSLSDSTGTLESYDYLGLSTVVKRGHSQPGVDLTYIKQSGESNGDAGDQYIGLDRFSRIADQRWRASSSDKDRFQYGYDRNSNRLYRDNTLDNNFDELYHANGASNGYDGLNQITDFRRGALSDANSDGTPDTVTTASRTQTWDFDSLGNFDGVNTDGTNVTRSHNKQNEITGISGATTPTYDANGNLTKDETGRTYEFDAWNRLIRIKSSGGSTLVEYEYDGLFRRIADTRSGTTTDFYYSNAWQVLEERVSGNAKIQYVWSPVYVDAMILRDRDLTGDSALEERLWVMHDANFNVTGLLDNSGNVVERFAYDPFGVATYYDASWGSRGSSSYAWIHLHQGGRLDSTTGNYHFRFRDYSPTLGRWLTMDPIGYAAGDAGLYRYVGNGPTVLSDWLGLDIGLIYSDQSVSGICCCFVLIPKAISPHHVGVIVWDASTGTAVEYHGGGPSSPQGVAKARISTGYTVGQIREMIANGTIQVLETGPFAECDNKVRNRFSEMTQIPRWDGHICNSNTFCSALVRNCGYKGVSLTWTCPGFTEVDHYYGRIYDKNGKPRANPVLPELDKETKKLIEESKRPHPGKT